MQAILRLHEDADFQEDAKDPSIEPALDVMRADPQAMERYEGDARLMRVLHKLRGFQVCTFQMPFADADSHCGQYAPPLVFTCKRPR